MTGVNLDTRQIVINGNRELFIFRLISVSLVVNILGIFEDILFGRYVWRNEVFQVKFQIVLLVALWLWQHVDDLFDGDLVACALALLLR